MRVKALSLRILNQIRHDKRTVALVIFAPLLILTIIYFILGSGTNSYFIGIINAPKSYVQKIEDNKDVNIATKKINKSDAKEEIKSGSMIAAIDLRKDKSNIYIDASNASNAKEVLSIIKSTAMENNLDKLSSACEKMNNTINKISSANPMLKKENSQSINTINGDFKNIYIYGKEDSSLFDNFGAVLVGIIVYFLVFLIAGINFLTERTSGTLEKMLSSPIKRSEIITGYTLGFSVLAIIQSFIVTLFVIYVLKLEIVGSILYVLLIILLTAVNALTLGMLVSTLANSEFQMVQFIPIIILPQIFLCGLFNLSGLWKSIGKFMPLYYTSDALTEVIIKGSGFMVIKWDILVLFALSIIFMILNTLLLKKQRKI